MKKRLQKIFGVLLSMSMFFSSFTAIAKNEEEYIEAERNPVEIVQQYTSRYIVKFKDNEKKEIKTQKAFQKAKQKKDDFIEQTYRKLEKQADTKQIEIFEKGIKKQTIINNAQSVMIEGDITQEIGSSYDIIRIEEKVDPDIFIKELIAENDKIEYVQPDYILELASESMGDIVVTETQEENQPSPAVETISPEKNIPPDILDEELNLNNEHGGSDTVNIPVIALIDTGVDTQHPELVEHLISGYDFCRNETTIMVDSGNLADAHGTHLAGILTQTAPEAKVMPLKAFESGKAYTSDIIRAIEYAEEKGASIVNCSWGSTDNNPALREVIENSAMLFVCAAGNNRLNVDEIPVYPGAYEFDNIINVASVNDDFGMSYFSNYGINSVDIAALGNNIKSTVPGGMTSDLSGTSVSAAFVSGAAALAAVPHHTVDMKGNILKSADRISCLEDKIGNGRYLNISNIAGGISGDNIEAYPQPDPMTQRNMVASAEEWSLFSQTQTVKAIAGDSTSVYLKDNGHLYLYNGALYDLGFDFLDVAQYSEDKYLILDMKNHVYIYDPLDYNDHFWSQIGGFTGTLAGVASDPNYGQQFVIASDGKIWGWGGNYYGEAGWDWPIGYPGPIEGEFPGFADTDDPSIVDEYYGMPITDVEKIIIGYGRTYMIKNNRDLHKLGMHFGTVNSSGCGAGFNDSNVKAFGLYDVKNNIIPDYSYNLTLYTDGSVMVTDDMNYQWGGCLGQKLTDAPFDNIDQLFRGQLAVKKDGTLWKWYVDENQQLQMEQFTGLSGVRYAWYSSGSYIAITNSNLIYAWGDNTNNKFGIGGGEYISQPTLVNIMNDTSESETVLVDEQYHTPGNPAYQANQQKLETMGWFEGINPEKGEFSAESGKLTIRKTSMHVPNSTELTYNVTKTFTSRTDNWKNDPRVSVWTNHFKGQYGVEIKGSFHQDVGQVYYDILGATNTGQSAVVARYKVDPGSNGAFHVYNNMLNGADTRNYTLWQNPTVNRTIRTVLNSETAEFYTTLDGSMVPEATTIEGAQPSRIFNMTDWNHRNPTEYITGFRISDQDRDLWSSTIAKLDSVKLIEYQKTHDIVDDAIESLSMSDITATPQAVTTNLTLPSQRLGANITWTSGRPDIIADDGTLVGDPAFAMDVIMTAKVTNPADGFTKYMEFKVTVKRRSGFEETYTGSYSGTQSSYGSEGTKTFSQLPMWRFSYPGIDNGTNWQLHASQVLVKNGYLTLKKISDRQTDNYQECLSGVRSLSNTLSSPLFQSANIGITAKVNGTGTMRFSPLTAEGKPICTLILDASTKHIQITYGVDEDGSIVNTTKRFDNIDPRTDRNYELELKANHTFTLYVDGEVICENVHFQRDAGTSPMISKLKMWITNITYKNTEIGNLKRLVVTNAKPVQNTALQNVWEDIDWLKTVIPETVSSDFTLPSNGEKGASTITWTSSKPQYITLGGKVTRPVWYGTDQKVTLTANVSLNGITQSCSFTVTVPHKDDPSSAYAYTNADTMICGGVSGLTGTERYGRIETAKVNSKVENGRLTGSYALLRFELSNYNIDDLTYAELSLLQINGKRGANYHVAAVKDDSFNQNWKENEIHYGSTGPVMLENLQNIAQITVSQTGMNQTKSLGVAITDTIKELQKKTPEQRSITLCIYNADGTADELELAMKEWVGNDTPGSYRPKIKLVRSSDSTDEYEHDVPVRTLGNEYDQMYDLKENAQKPDISGVTITSADIENGIYHLYIGDEQYACDPDGTPFFFWSAREGTFISESPDNRGVCFTLDPKVRGRQVNVIVGIGDSLGYMSKKSFLIGRNTENQAEQILEQQDMLDLEKIVSPEKISAFFDSQINQGQELAIGLDTSDGIAEFDTSGSTYFNSMESLIDAAGEQAGITLIDKENILFSLSPETAKSELQFISGQPYSGEENALSLLEKCEQALKTSKKKKKTAVVAASSIGDADAAADKIAQMRQNGIFIFLMVCTEEDPGRLSQTQGVYLSPSPLLLRLNLSDVMDTLSQADSMLLAEDVINTDDTDYLYHSDFRSGKHNFNANTAEQQFGKSIASVMAIYGCLPAVAAHAGESYNLFEHGTDDVYHLTAGNLNQMRSTEELLSFWEAMEPNFDLYRVSGVWAGSSELKEVLSTNLRRRFPVVIQNGSDSGIITGYTPSTGKVKVYIYGRGEEDMQLPDNSITVIDTYQYLMQAANQFGVKSETIPPFDHTIYLSRPDGYGRSQIEAVNYSGMENPAVELSEYDGKNIYKLSGLENDGIYLAGLKTIYGDDALPNLYNATKRFIIKKYQDEEIRTQQAWYYETMFEATNRGMINGSILDDQVYFEPGRQVRRSELLAMMLRGADIDVQPYAVLSQSPADSKVSQEMIAEKCQSLLRTAMDWAANGSDTNDILNLGDVNTQEKIDQYLLQGGGAWAAGYMNFAYLHGLINEQQYLGTEYFINGLESNGSDQISANIGGCDIKIRRDDAAYMLSILFIDNVLDLKNPTQLYEYYEGIDCERNRQWQWGTAFTDQGQITAFTREQIYQLFMNGVLVGDTERRLNPSNVITRAEACKMTVKSLFSLDDKPERIFAVFHTETMPAISDLHYEPAPKLGKDNVLGFTVTIPEAVAYPRTFKAVVYAKWMGNTALSQKAELVFYVDPNVSAVPIQIPGIAIYRSNQLLYTEVQIIDENGLRVTKSSMTQNVEGLNGQLAPQEVRFDTYDDTGNYYIFVDNPEHISEDDILNNDQGDEGKTLSHFDELPPGKYTLFEYHHKKVAGTAAFAPEDKLYYNAVFYNKGDNTGKVKINRLGVSAYGKRPDEEREHWELERTWHSFADIETPDDSPAPKSVPQYAFTPTGERMLQGDAALWITDALDYDRILISENNIGGYVWVMMEFEVLEGSVCFSTLAQKNEGDFKANFSAGKDRLKSTFVDLDVQVLKGMGSFDQTLHADPMEYFIDDSVSAGSKLTFSMSNRLYPQVTGADTFYTNTAPLFSDAKYVTPDTQTLGLHYDVDLANGQKQRLYFDGYHSSYLRDFPIPALVQGETYKGKEAFYPNEGFDEAWVQELKNINYNTYDTANLSPEEIQQAEAFAAFVGPTTMQGYGVTYQYDVTIHNGGSQPREFIYQAELWMGYSISYSINGGAWIHHGFLYDHGYDDDIKNFSGEVFRQTLPPGETTQIVFTMTQHTGSSATNKNAFVIQ